jgi:3-oxoacyl-[acyl-carrier-protein] synthase II
VLITGAGIVSAIGNNQSECLEALRKGQSGVGLVRFLPTEHKEFPVGEVKLSNEEMAHRLGIAGDKPLSPHGSHGHHGGQGGLGGGSFVR